MEEKIKIKICSRKTCKHKGIPQPISNFNRKTASADGYYPACRECVKAYEKSRGIDEYRRNYSKKWKQMFAKYDVFAHQISYCEKVQKDPKDPHCLQVECSVCTQWFNPTNSEVHNRINSLNGKKFGESKFYCSILCKENCQTYRRQTHRSSEAKNYSPMNRDAVVQNQLRQLVLERDNYICQECGATKDLICHHLESINQNPIESADIDRSITLCSTCHEKFHSQIGHRRQDLRCT